MVDAPDKQYVGYDDADNYWKPQVSAFFFYFYVVCQSVYDENDTDETCDDWHISDNQIVAVICKWSCNVNNVKDFYSCDMCHDCTA